MPIFDYRCKSCGKVFERLIFSGTRPAQVACPACGSEKTEKIFSSFSVGKTDRGGADGCTSGSCGLPGG